MSDRPGEAAAAAARGDGEPRRRTGGLAALAPLLRLRASRAQLVVALLAGLLGFALVTQVHSNRQTQGLGAARPEDLVGILSDLNARSDRLRAEIDDLQAARSRLLDSADQEQAALAEARSRAASLGILAGTLPATGPGIVLTVEDPRHSVRADVLLDALEELRDAGAEAVQVGDVRVVASTHFVDAPGGVRVDGHLLRPPYRFLVVGDPSTLTTALGIPGGVVDSVAQQAGASARIAQTENVEVSALRALQTPQYARPAPTASPAR